jgi:hypothetical protein
MPRHSVDAIALFAGLILCAVGAAGLVVRPFEPELLRWVWPGLLVVVGLAVLLGSRPRNGASSAGADVDDVAGAHGSDDAVVVDDEVPVVGDSGRASPERS